MIGGDGYAYAGPFKPSHIHVPCTLDYRAIVSTCLLCYRARLILVRASNRGLSMHGRCTPASGNKVATAYDAPTQAAVLEVGQKLRPGTCTSEVSANRSVRAHPTCQDKYKSARLSEAQAPAGLEGPPRARSTERVGSLARTTAPSRASASPPRATTTAACCCPPRAPAAAGLLRRAGSQGHRALWARW